MENKAIEIKKEGFFRVGMECGYLNAGIYVEKLELERDIADRVRRELNLKLCEFCDITSDTRKFLPKGRHSIAGGNRLSKKVLRLKLKVIVEEYELVDDAVREMKMQAPNMALFYNLEIHKKLVISIKMTKSQIFLYFCLSFIVGVFFSSFLELPSEAIRVFLILNVVLIFAFWKQKKAVVAGFCLFFIIFGFWRHQSFLSAINRPPNDKIWFFNDRKEKIIVIGTIKSDLAIKTNTNQFIIDSEQIVIDGKRHKASGKVLITTRRYPEYKYGDRLKILSELKAPQQLEEFNYKNYLAKDGVYSVMNFPKIEVIAENQGDWAYSKILFFKNKLRESLYQNLSPPQSSILAAIILGDQNAISKEWKQKLSITGIIHIISVSGAHIVILSGILMWTALALGFWRSQAFYVSLIFLFFYIALVGAPASAVRAGIMGGMFLFAQKMGRLSSGLRALTFAGAFMLLDNPLLLRYDIGFQLSFLATLGLMILTPFFQKWLVKIPDSDFFSLRPLIAMTMSAQVFTLPVLIHNFGYVSLVSPIVNVLIVPLMPFIMIFGFIFALAGAVSPFLGLISFWPSWILLTYMVKVVEWFSNIPWAFFTMNISAIYLIIFYFLLVVFIFREREKSKLFAA